MHGTVRGNGLAIRRRAVVGAAIGALGVLPVPRARGASLPSQVTVVVPFPAGANEGAARVLARQLGKAVPTAFTVATRGGQNGNIGALFVARGEPDGSRWLLGPASILTVNPALYGARTGFDPERELKIVATIGAMPSVLLVNRDFPAETLQQFVAYARASQVTYGSGGIGSPGHLTMEHFAQVAGLKLRHVGFRGGVPATADVASGEVPVACVVLGNALGSIRQGQVRALAVSSSYRSPSLPDVPTVGEAGFPDFRVEMPYYVMVSAATPGDLSAVIEELVGQALLANAVLVALGDLTLQPVMMSAAEGEAWRREERDRWAKLIETRGIAAR